MPERIIRFRPQKRNIPLIIMKLKVNIPVPSPKEVEEYLRLWDSFANYTSQESSLRKLFTITYPKNIVLDDVLIKVCSLNTFYNTNIYSPYTVAKHIISLDIDKALASEDLEIVNRLAVIKMGKEKIRTFYSFATKYCSHHRPTVYPIYDAFVEKILLHFRDMDKVYSFESDDLRLYPKYKNILLEFLKFYGLEMFDLKQIDKYLWQVSKKYFPKKY